MSLLIFIILLILLILVHELGHFVAAKLFGIRVDEFAIGFPPRLLRVRWGETDYTFNVLLLGGFVRIHGEDSGTDVRDPRSMASKPRLVQALVIVAGVVMNLLVGWLILSAAYLSGVPTAVEYQGYGTVTNAHPTIVGVLPHSPAEAAGLLSGDVVEKLQTADAQFDTRPLNTDRQADAVRAFIAAHQDESIVLTVMRGGDDKTVLAKGVEGLVEGRKAIGIELADVGVLRLSPPLALLQGAVTAKDLVVSTVQGLGTFVGGLFRGAGLGGVSGPVGIASAGASAVHEGFAQAAFLVALISINLAIINILPIPGLDGGRLLIIIIEGILRRPVSPRLVNLLSLAGLALLVVFMVFVTYHDIVRLIG